MFLRSGAPVHRDRCPLRASLCHRRQARAVQQLAYPIGLRFAHERGIDGKLAKELPRLTAEPVIAVKQGKRRRPVIGKGPLSHCSPPQSRAAPYPSPRSDEHTSELQSLMRNSSAAFCLTKKKYNN